MVKVGKNADPSLTVAEGEYLYREGDASQELYLIEKGRIQLLKGHGSDEGQMSLLEAGDFFGEVSLLTGGTREASARATADTQLLRIDGPLLRDLLKDPEIALKMLRRLAQHLAVSRERQLMADTAPSRPKTRSVGVASAPKLQAKPRAMTARLVHASGEVEVPDKADSLVGRSDPKTGFAPDVDLTSLDTQRSLSRRHARILKKGGEFFVTEEPGVRNGTFVNGKAVKAGMSAVVKDGDEVAFGLIKTTFRLD
jgi:CRP-like cAMP-binding protein